MIRKTPKTPVYKFEIYVVDFHHFGVEEVESILSNCEDMISVIAVHAGTKQVEWHDEIDINLSSTSVQACRKLFE